MKEFTNSPVQLLSDSNASGGKRVRTTYSVSVGVPPELALPLSEGANYFHFTRVGSEVQMLVGCVNLIQLHAAKDHEGTTTLAPQITHRFLLSSLGFNQLKVQLDEIGPIPNDGVQSRTKLIK